VVFALRWIVVYDCLYKGVCPALLYIVQGAGARF